MNESGKKAVVKIWARFLLNHNVKAAYIHSDVATLDRVKIMNDLSFNDFA